MVNKPLIRPAISGGRYVARGGWLTSHMSPKAGNHDAWLSWVGCLDDSKISPPFFISIILPIIICIYKTVIQHTLSRHTRNLECMHSEATYI